MNKTFCLSIVMLSGLTCGQGMSSGAITLKQNALVRSLAFNDNGKLLGGNGAGEVTLWDLKTNTAEKAFSVFGKAISSVASGGQTLAVGSFDGNVEVLIKGTGAPLRWSVGTEVTALQVSPDGQFVYVGSSDGKISKFNVQLKKEVLTWQLDNNLNALTLNPEGTLLAAGTMGGQLIVLPTTENRVLQQANFVHAVFGLSFHPDSTTLAVGLEQGGLKTYQWKTDIRQSIYSETEDVLDAKYSNNGQYLAFTLSNTVQLLDLKTGKTQALATPSDQVRSLAFSPDGKTLVAGTSNAVVVFGNATSVFGLRKTTPPSAQVSGAQAIPELKETAAVVQLAQKTLIQLDNTPALPVSVLKQLTNIDVLGDSKQVVLANQKSSVKLQLDVQTRYPAVTRQGNELYVPLTALEDLGYTLTTTGATVTLTYGSAFITLKASAMQVATLPTILKSSEPWQKIISNALLLDGKPAFRVSDLLSLVQGLTYNVETKKLSLNGKYIAKPFEATSGYKQGLVVVSGRQYLPLDTLSALGITPKLQGGMLYLTTNKVPYPLQVKIPDKLNKSTYDASKKIYLADLEKQRQAAILAEKKRQAELAKQKAEAAKEAARIAEANARIQKKLTVLSKEFPEHRNWVNLDGSYFAAVYFDENQRLWYHLYFVNDRYKRVIGKGCFNLSQDPIYGAQIYNLGANNAGDLVVIVNLMNAYVRLQVPRQDQPFCEFTVTPY